MPTSSPLPFPFLPFPSSLLFHPFSFTFYSLHVHSSAFLFASSFRFSPYPSLPSHSLISLSFPSFHFHSSYYIFLLVYLSFIKFPPIPFPFPLFPFALSPSSSFLSPEGAGWIWACCRFCSGSVMFIFYWHFYIGMLLATELRVWLNYRK